MPECIHCNVHFQSCCGCNPECRFNEKEKAGGYSGYDVDDSHRRCQGLHEQIQKILKKRLQLNHEDITRIGISYVLSDIKFVEGKGIEIVTDGSQNWLQIMVEIKENAFIMGSLDRSCDGEIKPCHFDLGSFWIGRTRYDISREVV